MKKLPQKIANTIIDVLFFSLFLNIWKQNNKKRLKIQYIYVVHAIHEYKNKCF